MATDPLARWEARAARWMRAVALIGLTALMIEAAIVSTDGLLRSFASAPIPGLEEIIQIATAIIIASCFPVVVAQRSNITIRFLGHLIGPRGNAWLEALGGTVLLVFLSVIAWQLAVFTQGLIEDKETSLVLLIPKAPSWIVATTIFALSLPALALIIAIDVVRAVTGLGIVKAGGAHDDAQGAG